jgi:hypothetical protein
MVDKEYIRKLYYLDAYCGRTLQSWATPLDAYKLPTTVPKRSQDGMAHLKRDGGSFLP